MVASVLAFLGLGSVVGAVGGVAKGAGSKIAVDATVKVTQGTLKRVTDHLTDKYELPENHDIFHTLDGSFKKSVIHLLKRYSTRTAFAADNKLIDRLIKLVPNANTQDVYALMESGIRQLLAPPSSRRGKRVVSDIVDDVESAVLLWLQKISGSSLPQWFEHIFRNGGKINRMELKSWKTVYAEFVAERIKTDERFFRILLADTAILSSLAIERIEKSQSAISEIIVTREVEKKKFDAEVQRLAVRDAAAFCVIPIKQRLNAATLVAGNLPRINRNDGFCFRLNVRDSGYVLVIQHDHVNDRWTFVPLNNAGKNLCLGHFSPGTHCLPDSSNGVFESIVGKHTFTAITSSNCFPETILSALKRLSTSDVIDLNANCFQLLIALLNDKKLSCSVYVADGRVIA